MRWRGVSVRSRLGHLRLAVAALNALVDLGLDRGKLLEVGEMRAAIGVDDDAGIEQIVGIGQLLQPAHDLVGIATPLGLDKWRHVAAGAMFGLERAIVAIDHQLHQIVDKARILIDGALIVEALRDDKMKIAVFGMAEDDARCRTRAREEPVQIVGGVGQDSIGNATSSMMTVVPLLRTEPTEGNMPARIFQSSACSAAAWVKRAGSNSLRPPTAIRRPALPTRSARFRRQTGTRPAIRPRRRRKGLESTDGMPAWSSTERSEARSMISSAFAPALPQTARWNRRRRRDRGTAEARCTSRADRARCSAPLPR